MGAWGLGLWMLGPMGLGLGFGTYGFGVRFRSLGFGFQGSGKFGAQGAEL